MSFGGPPPSMAPPSGPFEASMTKIASSPYMLAAAIFLLNIGGRLLPMEITKEQEQFLNQPWFRRFIIFVIFFVATRNLVTAAWLAFVVILCIGYLFNENSSLYIFGRGNPSVKAAVQSVGLTQEEQIILKSLQLKAEKIKEAAAKPIELSASKSVDHHSKYKKALDGLWKS